MGRGGNDNLLYGEQSQRDSDQQILLDKNNLNQLYQKIKPEVIHALSRMMAVQTVSGSYVITFSLGTVFASQEENEQLKELSWNKLTSIITDSSLNTYWNVPRAAEDISRDLYLWNYHRDQYLQISDKYTLEKFKFKLERLESKIFNESEPIQGRAVNHELFELNDQQVFNLDKQKDELAHLLLPASKMAESMLRNKDNSWSYHPESGYLLLFNNQDQRILSCLKSLNKSDYQDYLNKKSIQLAAAFPNKYSAEAS